MLTGTAHAAPAPPAVGCYACLVLDDGDRVLFARRTEVPLANASTTKMVTALVVLGRADTDERVRVSRGAAIVGMGGLDLDAGDTYSVEDLLYALLMTSSNEAAVALAEHVAGSEAAFVGMMNRLAMTVGADEAHFVNAHGLDAPGHRSSAADLATVAEELLERPLLARIVATRVTTIRGPDGLELIENRNPLLETYRGAVGVKTGFTNNAGNVLVAAAERRGRAIIAVVMRSKDAADDARRLLDYGFARLRRTVLVAPGAALGALVFDPSGVASATPTTAVRGIAVPADVETVFIPDASVNPPVERGQRLGTIIVTASGRNLASIDAVAVAPVGSEETSWLAELLVLVLSAFGGLVGQGR
ncbi:MAG: D-alanyl-D-alanine carboxypeptidase family protein [Actinomycetota bacterium]